MKHYILLFFLIISACGSEDKDPKPVLESDPILVPHMEQFYIDAEAHGWTGLPRNVIVRFMLTPGEDGILFSASHKEGDTWVCELSHTYLDKMSSYKSSVYREMAHVLLNKPYNNSTDDISLLEDIMCIMFSPAQDDSPAWPALLDKLFEK